MRYLAALALTAALGCTPNQTNPTPDQIRENAAKATSTAAADLKAAAEGVRDGLHQTTTAKPVAVNINTATRPALESIPGLTPALSARIVAHRPYTDPSDLIKKHILTHAQYDPIAGRITTAN